MTVLDVGPGTGYYTELLAPALAKDGLYLATNREPPSTTPAPSPHHWTPYEGVRFDEMLRASPAVYGKVQVVRVDYEKPKLNLDGKVDMVLLMREVHMMQNWGTLDVWLREIHRALKPNGVLGVEEHRAAPGVADAVVTCKQTGYVPEAWVIAKIEAAGFALAGKSEINANPRDTKWTIRAVCVGRFRPAFEPRPRLRPRQRERSRQVRAHRRERPDDVEVRQGGGRRRSLSTVQAIEAGWTGLEPAASGVTGRRYNQLNYHPSGSRPSRSGSAHFTQARRSVKHEAPAEASQGFRGLAAHSDAYPGSGAAGSGGGPFPAPPTPGNAATAATGGTAAGTTVSPGMTTSSPSRYSQRSFGGPNIASGFGRHSASRSTSSMCSTSTMRVALSTRRGTSRRSLRFSFGTMTVVMPLRCAARSFSFRPPMGITRPRSGDLAGHRQIPLHRHLDERVLARARRHRRHAGARPVLSHELGGSARGRPPSGRNPPRDPAPSNT